MSSAGALHRCRSWFSDQGWKPFPFQLQAWSTYLDGGCGLVNAPTGSGKTLFVAIAGHRRGRGAHEDGPSVVRWRSTYLDHTDPCTSEGDPSERGACCSGLRRRMGSGCAHWRQYAEVKQATKEEAPPDINHYAREYPRDAQQ